jgi:ABC-type sugar transport system ATPase subunit
MRLADYYHEGRQRADSSSKPMILEALNHSHVADDRDVSLTVRAGEIAGIG